VAPKPDDAQLFPGGWESLRTFAWISLLAAVALGVAGCDQKKHGFKLQSYVPADTHGFSNALFQSAATRLEGGHHVEIIKNGQIFDALEDAFANGRHSIHVVLFIWRPGQASDRLIKVLGERTKAGVACRVLVDPIGSIGFDDKVRPALQEIGCEVRLFRPLKDKISADRNHRKIVVVDGRVAFTGGFGIHDQWLGNGLSKEEWRETNVRVRGPVVLAMQQAFAENWQESGGALLPPEAFPEPDRSGPMKAAFIASSGSTHLSRAERLIHLLCQAATKRLWVGNAYFVPTQEFMHCLADKRRSGVDVQVLAPGDINDQRQITFGQRRTYNNLLPSGVRIFEYQPTMMHAKIFIVDDHLAAVGSINLDELSLDNLEEDALLVDDPGFAGQMMADWRKDLEVSKEIHQKR